MPPLPASLVAAAVLAMATAAPVWAAPVFNLTFIAGTSAAAQAGFTQAADYWSSQLTDVATIDLTVGTGALAPGVLGSASSSLSAFTYAAFQHRLAVNATSPLDAAAVAGLPASAPFPIYINRTADNPNGVGSATPYLDTSGANNGTIAMTNANAKALGLVPAPQAVGGCVSACDGFIQFSTGFTYDYDRGDGITAGRYDFVGIAIHEIGHALGFVSGVDILDVNSPDSTPSPPAVNGFYPADVFSFVTPLDMFRCSTASVATGAALDFTADNRAKRFSLDDCATTLGTFANGLVHGDGRQASHWKDALGLGSMDPTIGTGELVAVTALDLMAFDVIGWERLPIAEPGSLILGGVWVGGLIMARRRRVR